MNRQFYQFRNSCFYKLIVNSQGLQNRITEILKTHFQNRIFMFYICHEASFLSSFSIVCFCILKMSLVYFMFIQNLFRFCYFIICNM